MDKDGSARLLVIALVIFTFVVIKYIKISPIIKRSVNIFDSSFNAI